MQYYTTRAFPTASRQYEAGDAIDPASITAAEWIRGTESGAVVPARWYGTAAELAARGIPGPGVQVYEADTRVARVGDGMTAVASLPQVGISTYGRFLNKSAVKTADYMAVVRDLILVDTTSGNVVITLPEGAAAGDSIGIRRVSAGTNTLTVRRTGTDTIAVGTGTATNITLALQDRVVILESDGAGGWTPVYGYQALASLDTRYSPSPGPNQLTAGEATLLRTNINATTITLPTGTMRVGYFTAEKTETKTQVRIGCGSVAAAATPTLIRVGVFSVAGDGALTLIASTPNDTSLLVATQTMYTKALSVTVDIVRGTRYAVGPLVVTSTTAPQTFGVVGLPASEIAVAPQLAAVVTGLSDLPSTVAAGSLAATNGIPYVALLP